MDGTWNSNYTNPHIVSAQSYPSYAIGLRLVWHGMVIASFAWDNRQVLGKVERLNAESRGVAMLPC